MWKALSGIAALLLLVSAFFAYKNNAGLATEVTLKDNAESNLAKAEERKSEAESGVLLAENELKTVTSERDLANEQLIAAGAELEELNTTLSEKDATLADIESEAKKAEDALDLIGEIKVIQAKLTQYTTQIADADAKENSLKNLRTAAIDKKLKAEQAIARQKLLVENQSSGRMPEISARVTSIQPEWGFAVISAGSSQGVVGNAKVDFIRGGSVIGQGTVTQLETGRSIITILKNSLAEGDYPQPGDRVSTSSESVAPRI